MPSTNESLIWLGKGGESPLLAGDAGHKPLGKVPNPLRGCSQYPERAPYTLSELQVTIP